MHIAVTICHFATTVLTKYVEQRKRARPEPTLRYACLKHRGNLLQDSPDCTPSRRDGSDGDYRHNSAAQRGLMLHDGVRPRASRERTSISP
ncbi:hypothetical protein AAFF_G00095870 [Aldrovandia affinis]|uniref:Uncharacterized protein n=1 Tax=Aldrovandia affinis TaxID=143900 RepID=A0AAD7RVY0_9TELE|nr:hypothetical protein AAFF_G00095870 [Aldrovandia affinis]